MKTDLHGIPFDHFQRYATAASLVRTLGDGSSVLEVGANRQRLLGDFLPHSKILYTDMLTSDAAPDFVVADACNLPFEDRSYDAVVSLDVLEHIPPEKRRLAVEEMARVASRIVVISCPIDKPWVHAAERDAHAVWRRYFDKAYPWLEEHEEFGLVEPVQVEAALAAAGMHYEGFGRGDARLWVTLMGMHFVKEAVSELSGAIAATDRFYNTSLFDGDRGPECYRYFFVGVRDVADMNRIRSATVPKGAQDPSGLALLQELGQALQPVVDRLRRAEGEWRGTAEALVDTERRLQEQLEHANEQWQLSAGMFQDAERRLQNEALQHHQTGLQLRDVSARALAMQQEADRLKGELKQAHQEQLAFAKASEERHLAEMDAASTAAQERLDSYRMDMEREAELAEARHQQAAELASSKYQTHLQELTMRVKGLERRQRFALAGVAILALAGIAIALFTSGV